MFSCKHEWMKLMIYYATFKVVMFKTPPKGTFITNPVNSCRVIFTCHFVWCPFSLMFYFFPQEYHSISGRFVSLPILKVFSQELSPFHMKTMSQMNVSPQGTVNIDYRFSLKPPPTPRIASPHIAWLRSEIAHAQNPRNLQQDRKKPEYRITR